MKGRNAIRGLIFGVVGAIVLAGLAWGSGDPWKSKPYQQWDDKDVRKILNDSPWSKVVRVDAPWANDRDAGGGGNDAGPGGPPPATGVSRGSGGGGMGAGGAGGSSDQGAAIPQVAFVVRWVSALTIREAVFRSAILNGQMKEDEAEKKLEQPYGAYEVLVAGPDMRPFRGADESALKDRTTLTTKKTKQKLSPSSVQIERTTDGKTIVGILFSFSEKTATGEPTFGAEEKGADFSCAFGGAIIRASFDISKMDNSKGRDL